MPIQPMYKNKKKLSIHKELKKHNAKTKTNVKDDANEEEYIHNWQPSVWYRKLMAYYWEI